MTSPVSIEQTKVDAQWRVVGENPAAVKRESPYVID